MAQPGEAYREHGAKLDIGYARLGELLKLRPADQARFEERANKIRLLSQQGIKEQRRDNLSAQAYLGIQSQTEGSVSGSGRSYERHIRSINDAIGSEPGMDKTGRNETYKAAINVLFEREVFSALMDKWLEEYNRENNFNKTYDNLKNDAKFNEFIKRRGLEEIQNNLDGAIHVTTSPGLNQIIGISDEQSATDEQKRLRDAALENVHKFVQNNQDLLTAYNSYQGREAEFEAKYHKSPAVLKVEFAAIFSNLPGYPAPQTALIIDGIFAEIIDLCETAALAKEEFKQCHTELILNKDSEEGWAKALKATRDRLEQQVVAETASAAVLADRNAPVPSEYSSYSPGFGSTGYHVENSRLHVDVAPNLMPSVSIRRINGVLIFEIEDKYSDPGTVNKKRCTEEELPFMVTELICDHMLNDQLTREGATKPADSVPQGLNSIITDSTMMDIVLNLIPRLRTDQRMVREDLVVIRNIYNLIINEDNNIPYIATRVTRIQNFIQQKGNAAHLNVLLGSANNAGAIKGLTVFKVINREV